MNQAEAIDVTREAIWVILFVGGPIMLIGLTVGLIISLFQALTQIQEMTLAFVPKILAILLSLMALFPFIMTQLVEFGIRLFDKIQNMGIS